MFSLSLFYPRELSLLLLCVLRVPELEPLFHTSLLYFYEAKKNATIIIFTTFFHFHINRRRWACLLFVFLARSLLQELWIDLLKCSGRTKAKWWWWWSWRLITFHDRNEEFSFSTRFSTFFSSQSVHTIFLPPICRTSIMRHEILRRTFGILDFLESRTRILMKLDRKFLLCMKISPLKKISPRWQNKKRKRRKIAFNSTSAP